MSNVDLKTERKAEYIIIGIWCTIVQSGLPIIQFYERPMLGGFGVKG